MKFKRVVSALTAAALAAVLLAAPASAATTPAFRDIEGHPAQEVIEKYAGLGIVNGVGDDLFEPDRTLTRAELSAILDRTFSYQAQYNPNYFPDLWYGEWYYDCMLRLNAAGILLGDDMGLIRPNDTVSWQEALTMLARSFGIQPRTDVYMPYTVSEWALGTISAMYAAGYLPMDRYLDFSAPFTRADTLVVLDNIVSDLGWSAAGKILFRGKLLPILAGVPVNQYNKDAFYRWGSRMYYSDGVTPVAYGVDVSAYQKDINWWAVAADGIDYAILRIGGRGYGSEGRLYWDTYFEQNLAGAQAAGLDVGIYFFSQAITPWEAQEEAWQVLSHLGGRPLTYPIVYDWESISGVGARTDGLDGATLTACAKAFCDVIASAGYQPMVYFNATDGLLRYDLSQLTAYPFWYAYYPPSDSTDPWLYYDFRMWQYTSSGSVSGIPGRADMNICFNPYGKVHV